MYSIHTVPDFLEDETSILVYLLSLYVATYVLNRSASCKSETDKMAPMVSTKWVPSAKIVPSTTVISLRISCMAKITYMWIVLVSVSYLGPPYPPLHPYSSPSPYSLCWTIIDSCFQKIILNKTRNKF